ncbi:MAG: ClpXP protease specificity-enhancing factor [Sinobacteraceae bacterium]|nr:ClpXP protease specificity-enhancing factor [Nevskiaceae bacterium]
MTTSPLPSRRPYLLRAMHQWMSDCGYTPHVIVNAEAAEARLPRAYVRDGRIVLNLSYTATQRLDIGNEWVEFDARFSGAVQHVSFPVSAVLGVYARETGEGMVFSEQEDGGPEAPPPSGPGAGPDGPSGPAPEEPPPARRPQLKVVK